MNYQIADALAAFFINLPYISRTAGCVDTVKEPVKGKKYKRIPVSRKVYLDDADDFLFEDTPLKRMIPRTSETGILYFEDLGNKLNKSSGRIEHWNGELLLVGWLNTKRTDGVFAVDAREQIRNMIPQDITGSIEGKMRVSELPPKRPSPFEKYDYDESETQYLTFPLEYFTMKLKYSVVGPRGCSNGDISITNLNIS